MGKTGKDIKIEELGNTDGSICAALIEKPTCSNTVEKKLKNMAAARDATLATLGCYGQQAIMTLVDIMENGEKEDSRLKAAIRILEYTVGKPSEAKQPDKNNKQVSLSDEEFEEIIEDGKEEELRKMIENKYGKTAKR